MDDLLSPRGISTIWRGRRAVAQRIDLPGAVEEVWIAVCVYAFISPTVGDSDLDPAPRSPHKPFPGTCRAIC
ncbi:Hypothetical protein SMAX5B_021095 [Scophthalmus maximus]|uniref:Uncharacterized protein n=1 Tax=Scophthalmus maximus TaxID=52904 RepID=A0A2U9CDJ2_SCOMX|nr:Hypothetical protein SMAX5B_021095 [Scophthalmus maximus]